MESILTGSITAWYGNWTGQDRKALQRVMHSAKHTIGSSLPALRNIYSRRCMTRALSIKKDSARPGHKLFRLLKSGSLCSHKTRTERLRRRFYPQTIRSSTATHDGPSTHLLPLPFSHTRLSTSHTISLSLSLSPSRTYTYTHYTHTHTHTHTHKSRPGVANREVWEYSRWAT
ncbi:hypothetical protein LDENG_00099570 [Lucifuga dentata]|nr:hypothetical protein LDENG_00099570 [Lucifuga dentata]